MDLFWMFFILSFFCPDPDIPSSDIKCCISLTDSAICHGDFISLGKTGNRPNIFHTVFSRILLYLTLP